MQPASAAIRAESIADKVPTLTSTSATFGRIRNTVTSTARQVMLGVKYYF